MTGCRWRSLATLNTTGTRSRHLPTIEILACGPPPSSGTRDAFVELAMHMGGRQLPHVQQQGQDDAWIDPNCTAMRSDGRFVEAGEDYAVIVQALQADPDAMGIFGYSYLYEDLETLKPVSGDGVEPGIETIGALTYPISWPVFLYVKNAHRGVIPQLDAFIAEYMSDQAIAPGGDLSQEGLVPFGHDDDRVAMQMSVPSSQQMTPPQ